MAHGRGEAKTEAKIEEIKSCCKEEAIEAYKNVIQKANPQEHAPLVEHAKGRIEELEQNKK